MIYVASPGQIAELKTVLTAEGRTPRTAQDHAYVMAHLSRRLESEGPTAAEPTTRQVERFAQVRRAEGGRRRPVAVAAG